MRRESRNEKKKRSRLTSNKNDSIITYYCVYQEGSTMKDFIGGMIIFMIFAPLIISFIRDEFKD